MSNDHQPVRSICHAKVICKQVLPTAMEELNGEMNKLIQKRYEPIKMSGVAEEGISRI